MHAIYLTKNTRQWLATSWKQGDICDLVMVQFQQSIMINLDQFY